MHCARQKPQPEPNRRFYRAVSHNPLSGCTVNGRQPDGIFFHNHQQRAARQGDAVRLASDHYGVEGRLLEERVGVSARAGAAESTFARPVTGRDKTSITAVGEGRGVGGRQRPLAD